MITTTTTPSPRSDTRPRRRSHTPLFIQIAAWSVPVLMVGQFALLAVIPVAAIVAGTLINSRARALRWWAALLGIVYATPLAVWIIRPDSAQSLSKDIHPVLLTAVVVASIAFLFAVYSRSKK